MITQPYFGVVGTPHHATLRRSVVILDYMSLLFTAFVNLITSIKAKWGRRKTDTRLWMIMMALSQNTKLPFLDILDFLTAFGTWWVYSLQALSCHSYPINNVGIRVSIIILNWVETMPLMKLSNKENQLNITIIIDHIFTKTFKSLVRSLLKCANITASKNYVIRK